MIDLKKTIKTYIYYLLSKREYSEKEIKTKVLMKFSKKIEKDEINDLKLQIDEIILFFIENNYLSNERYAEVKTRSLINKKKGPKRISQELKNKGIPDNLINQFLLENQENLSEEINKLKEKYNNITDEKEKQKIYRKLLYKGYSYEQINEILK